LIISLAEKYTKIISNEKIVVVLVSLFSQFAFSQIELRMPFKRSVRNDLVPVENVIVLM
jgi:hypothetical protein